jgi:hypothetical protein
VCTRGYENEQSASQFAEVIVPRKQASRGIPWMFGTMARRPSNEARGALLHQAWFLDTVSSLRSRRMDRSIPSDNRVAGRRMTGFSLNSHIEWRKAHIKSDIRDGSFPEGRSASSFVSYVSPALDLRQERSGRVPCNRDTRPRGAICYRREPMSQVRRSPQGPRRECNYGLI